jgi:hypothetical protein
MYCVRVRVALLGVAVALALWGCSSPNRPTFVAKPEPWREDEEQACLAAGVVRESRFVRARSALGGPSMCGAAKPFEMTGAAGGRIQLNPPAMLRCPMIPQVERWLTAVVDPAARRHLGQGVAEIKVAASYACRPINHVSGARLSEHGRANALDVSRFVLADGSVVTVKDGWHALGPERAFLREIHAGACNEFTTVLGPNADAYHRDHFHLDLARHGRDGLSRICK